MRTALMTFVLGFFVLSTSAQMTINGTTLYGNEWIDHNKQYYKLSLEEDGIYRISYNELIQMGFPINAVLGSRIQIYHMGVEIPLYVSTTSVLGSNDYVEFVGVKNRGELDEHLYINRRNDQLNPDYSLFSDESIYFLTYDNVSAGTRYTGNPLGNSGITQNHYLHEELLLFSSRHHKPTYRGEDHIQYSHFDKAEGFGTKLESSHTLSIPATNIVPVGSIFPNVVVRLGGDDATHNVQIRFNGAAKQFDSFTSFETKEYNFNLSYNELSANNSLTINGTSSSDDKLTVASAKLYYPRQAQIISEYFDFPVKSSTSNTSFSFATSGGTYIIIDEENNHRTVVNSSGGSINFGVAPGSDLRKIRIIRSDRTRSITNAVPRQFIDYTNFNPSYLIHTSDRLYDPTDFNNAVKTYGDYRASSSGGNHNVITVITEDIIDQFAYGIERHAIGGRNFAFFVNQHWPNLNYWFNIGKGIEYPAVRLAGGNSATLNEKYHVPTYGAPGSDLLMLSEVDKAVPLYSVGRLAATTDQEVADYLEKMIVHDDKDRWEHTVEDRYWMKRALHMSGGRDIDQQIIFFSLENMRFEIEYVQFGADVTTVRKFPDEVVTASLSQTSSELINDGVSLITFFGHSAPGVFDLSLEDPSQYTNFERYPFIVSLGCFSGNIHTPSFGISEDFVIEPRKSAIGFLASSGTAYIGAQANSGKKLYEFLGGQHYNGSIGNALKSLSEFYQNDNSLELRTLMQQYALHGDPALKITENFQPDLTIDDASVEVISGVVDPTDDSFEVSFDIANLGSAVNAGNISIEVIHYGPAGDFRQAVTTQIENPLDIQTLLVEVPLINKDNLVGKNTIEILVDTNNAIGERSEQNNSLFALTANEGHSFIIADNGISPVSPGEFEILNASCPFELQASTNNGLLDAQNYRVEIDTTELFNSPLLEQGTIVSSNGGLLNYAPSIARIPNTVYYWRMSPVNTLNNGPLWTSSSFVYLPNSSLGWNQSHYFQYLKNDLNTLEIDEDRRWQFAAEAKDLRFDVGLEVDDGQWIYVDGVPWGSLNPRNEGNFISVVVMDPEELIYFANSSHPYSELSTTGDYFGYSMSTSSGRKQFMDLIDNVPEGSRVFVSTIMVNETADWHTEDWDGDASIYGHDVYSKLEENGILDIGVLRNLGTVPFVVAFEKGGEVIAEEYGQDINDNIEKTYNFFWNLTEGFASTTEIGPVSNWDRIEWNFSERQNHDGIFLKVFGITSNGTETLVFDNITQTSFNLSSLNNSAYERIRLEIHAEDSFGSGLLDSDRTSPQVDFLRVLYTPLGDLAIVTDDPSFSYSGDVVNQNEEFVVHIPIRNISTSSIGLTDVEFIITDPSGAEIIQTATVGPLAPKSQSTVSFSYDPQNIEGDYTWEIDVNPTENPEECYYLNNYATRNFQVTSSTVVFVSFENFQVEKIENKESLLTWSTRSERNSSHFEVLRSNSGSQFEKMGEVRAAGNSNDLQEYEFIDESPEIGKNYYQIKELDINGDYVYSDILQLSFDEESLKFTIVPNPSPGNQINVHGSRAFEGLNLSLFDNVGRTISLKNIEQTGSSIMLLKPATELSSGNYYLKIEEGAKTYIKKVVIATK
jgi:hypothetical protein